MSETFAVKAQRFFDSVRFNHPLANGVEVMNPYRNEKVRGYVRAFLEKFFSDERKRVYVFGINPGRFGAGITGVSFTDPVALESDCGIPNDSMKRREPSAQFVYEFIRHWGGAAAFYHDFFLTATCPLGFVKDGVNCNFYDSPDLIETTRPFITETMRKQVAFGARPAAVVLGTGTLKRYFEALNAEHGFFARVDAVEHPRFVMQYRRRRIGEYIEKYRRVLAEALESG